jgi:hypothetical protein
LRGKLFLLQPFLLHMRMLCVMSFIFFSLLLLSPQLR